MNHTDLCSGTPITLDQVLDARERRAAIQREMLKDLDVLMIPVGGYYTIDAAQARQLVEYVTPNVVIPMHYRGMGFGFDVLGSVNEYLGLCQNVVRYQNVIEITKDMPRQTAAMTF